MDVPLELSIRHMDVPDRDRIRGQIEERIADLEQVCSHIISCRIAIDEPHQHQSSGNPIQMRAVVRIPPGHEVVVREQSDEGTHDNLMAVIQKTFQVLRRQIRELDEKRHRRVKEHSQQYVTGIIERLYKNKGYGFLRSIDDEEIYFHRNSVLNNEFDRAEPGTGVRFVRELQHNGPAASTVRIVYKKNRR